LKYPSASAMKIGAKLVRGELFIFNVTSGDLVGSGVAEGNVILFVFETTVGWMASGLPAPPQALNKTTLNRVIMEKKVDFIAIPL
jgi:hypothetical protein